jgi:2-polyprenyl-6-methoxyphenol hydroxylase-like FAD-dependent oxidoreductase
VRKSVEVVVMGPELDTQILIVGGGPVGLALALDLAWHDMPSMVIERDVQTAPVLLPKATGLHERTMEMCRRWGIVDRVIEAGFPAEFPGDSVYATSLDGYIIGRSAIPSAVEREAPDSTPEKRRRCAQYEFDPLLARAVGDRGLTDIRYSLNFEGITEDDDGVLVEVSDVESGRRSSIRARYVVGCDGAGSSVRSALGVPFDGKMLDFSLSAMIRIPDFDIPEELLGGERYIMFGPEGAWSIITSIDGRDIWRLTVVGSQEKLDPATFDMEPVIRRALGSKIPYEILRIAPWRRSQCSAASYRVGHVFLAGDAAHTTSPTGGHGLNTGIGDVSDLGWILTALVQGWGGEHLLEAYDAERRPVAIRNSTSSTANYRGWFDSNNYSDLLDPGPSGVACRKAVGDRLVESLYAEWNSLGIDLGFRYEGSPVILADGTPPPPDDASIYVPTARPGHRAPHVWLEDGRSTLDLFGRGFVLLQLGEGNEPTQGLEEAAARVGMPLEIIRLPEPDVAAVTALYERQLVLVRPDGHVAWRGDTLPDDVETLVDVVRGAAAAPAADPLPAAAAAGSR